MKFFHDLLTLANQNLILNLKVLDFFRLYPPYVSHPSVTEHGPLRRKSMFQYKNMARASGGGGGGASNMHTH